MNWTFSRWKGNFVTALWIEEHSVSFIKVISFSNFLSSAWMKGWKWSQRIGIFNEEFFIEPKTLQNWIFWSGENDLKLIFLAIKLTSFSSFLFFWRIKCLSKCGISRYRLSDFLSDFCIPLSMFRSIYLWLLDIFFVIWSIKSWHWDNMDTIILLFYKLKT